MSLMQGRAVDGGQGWFLQVIIGDNFHSFTKTKK